MRRFDHGGEKVVDVVHAEETVVFFVLNRGSLPFPFPFMQRCRNGKNKKDGVDPIRKSLLPSHDSRN